MDNQHRKIKGYRELTQAEIDLMNEIKAFGPQLQALCEKVHAHIESQRYACMNEVNTEVQNADEIARLDAANPELWASWGRETLKLSLMQLTRAIAQPTFF